MIAWKQCSNKLAAQGYDFFEIEKIMIKKAQNNQVSGNRQYDESHIPLLSCSNCGKDLDHNRDYFTEITGLSCDIWYLCPECGKYNHFID